MTNESRNDAASGIFLVFGGLGKTVIESQVLVPASHMAAAGIKVQVWSFAWARAQYQDDRRALKTLADAFPQVGLRVFWGVRPGVPLSDWMNALLLMWWMRRLRAKPVFIHARGEYAATVAAIAKLVRRYCLVWDDRGDPLSEFQEHVQYLTGFRKWRAPLVLKAISRRLRMANRGSDAAIFVSDELRILHGSELPPEKTLIVPCAADEDLFYFDTELRKEARAALGYSESDIVLIYVGTAAIWQCVPEMVSLINQALKIDPAARALIVTPDCDKFSSAFPEALTTRVRIASGRLHDMNRYLNAGDFGLMLKIEGAISRVASPVKFAEYSLAGLRVVTSGTVPQVEQIGGEIGNVVSIKDFIENCLHRRNDDPDCLKRQGMAARARTLLGRRRYREPMVNLYLNLMGEGARHL